MRRVGPPCMCRFLAALVLAACAPPDPRTPASTTIDGLTLVHRVTLDDGTIASAALADDGRIVAFARPNIIAVFDSTGTHHTTLGRTGSGPGEFRMLTWAAPGGGDSVWAFDFQLRRLSLFVGDAFADSWRIEGAATPNAIARLGSGEVLVVDPFMPMPARRGGLSVDTVGLLALRPPATTPQPLARIPWYTRYQDGASVALVTQPLGPTASVVARESTVVVAFGDRPEIMEYSAAGALLRRVALALPLRAVSEAEVAWARRRAERPSTLGGVSELLKTVPLPTTVPAIAGLLMDREELWVRTFQVSDSVPTMWYAFREGRAAHDSLLVPAGAQLLAVRAPLVLLKVTAESGEEAVALYRRSPRAP